MTDPTDWLRMAELCLDMAAAAPELDRLRTIGAGMDGYGRGGRQRGGPGTTSDPTSALLVSLAGGKVPGDVVKGETVEAPTPDTWRVPNDGIGVLLEKLVGESNQMVGCARRIAGLKRLIENRGDERYGRQSSLQGDCLACDKPVTGTKEDRIRSGYCPTCYRAWVRFRLDELSAGRVADHEVFRKRRAAKARAEAKASERHERVS